MSVKRSARHRKRTAGNRSQLRCSRLPVGGTSETEEEAGELVADVTVVLVLGVDAVVARTGARDGVSGCDDATVTFDEDDDVVETDGTGV